MLATRSPLLMRVAALHLALLLVALVGLLIDPRVITGAPAWLKPAKFAASVAVYTWSLAWMLEHVPPTRTLQRATTATGVILTLEVLLIFAQAARGTTSHFNVDTPLDAAIFSAMGAGILIAWIASMVILWQHLRSPAVDRGMALAFRLGLALNIVGASVGWTMTRPYPGQVAAITRGDRPRIVGSHTVGGQDGGPGLPVTGWSTAHGDLRVAHFVGMHALQLLPLLLLGVRRLRGVPPEHSSDAFERRTLALLTAGYAATVVALFVQALAGHPLFTPATG